MNTKARAPVTTAVIVGIVLATIALSTAAVMHFAPRANAYCPNCGAALYVPPDAPADAVFLCALCEGTYTADACRRASGK